MRPGICSQLGQTIAECLLMVVGVALVAILGFSMLGSGIGSQSATIAEALSGSVSRPATRFENSFESGRFTLADFDSINPAAQDSLEAKEEAGSAALIQGFASGLLDNLRTELSALLSPVETARAIFELVKLLVTDLAETAKLLFDELVAKQFDKLINGNDYERGFVIGNQVSAVKALSVLAKASGAAILTGVVKRTDTVNDISRINGRFPINSRYAGRTHPSGVKFNQQGFPDFSPYTKAEVEIDGLTGRYDVDARLANEAVGLEQTPKDFVWHHVEDGRTMQLIPQDIHNAARHTGGAAVIRGGRTGK